jgi:protein gp37
MSDLFHASVPGDFVQDVFSVMRKANWHEYQILTKRSERLVDLDGALPWAPHIWMGVSVENARFVHRIDHLRSTKAHVKFLSIEPLFGPLSLLDLGGIQWVIVGGESGPRARPMQHSWVLDIRDQCRDAGVAFFFKQWGGVFKSRTGRELEGRTWDEMPTSAERAAPAGWPIRPVERRA